MLPTLLRHLPKSTNGSRRRRIIFPDGTLGSFEVMATRRGTAGSIAFALQESEGDYPATFLIVTTPGASAVIPAPLPELPAGQTLDLDPAAVIEFVLTIRRTLEKIVEYFPAVQAELLGATGRLKDSVGL